METQSTLPESRSALSRRLSVVAARERGVGPGQLALIGLDADIFEVFCREYVDGIERFVARRVGDRETAADLTAEIFLAAIDSAHRYQARLGTPKAWLFGIARVLVAGDARRRDRQRVGEERLRGSALLDEDDAARMDARIDAAAQARRLYEAMDALPEAERAVLKLVALDELALTEAAAAAGVRPARNPRGGRVPFFRGPAALGRGGLAAALGFRCRRTRRRPRQLWTPGQGLCLQGLQGPP